MVSSSKRRRATAALLVLAIVLVRNATAQIQSTVLLPGADDTTSNVWYSAIACSDDRNCSVMAYEFNGHGYNGFLKRTMNAGVSWTRQPLSFLYVPTIKERNLIRIYCIDSSNIMLLGDSGRMYRTFDAGRSWVDQSYVNPAAAGYANFWDSATGVVTYGGGLVLRTSDAGNTWQNVAGLPYAVFTSPQMFSRDSFVVYKRADGPVYTIAENSSRIDSFSLIFDPAFTDTGGQYAIHLIQWFGATGEGLGIGRHARPGHGFDTGWTVIVRTTDAGRNWIILNDGQTRITGAPTSFAANRDGTAIMTSRSGSYWAWSPDWRSNLWYYDSLQGAFDFTEIADVVLLDAQHALFRLDDGLDLQTPFHGQIVSVTLNLSAGVSTGVQRDDIPAYPNPATSAVRFRWVAKDALAVVDALGREYSVPNNNGTLDISSLPPGVYYVSDGTHRARFVKE